MVDNLKQKELHVNKFMEYTLFVPTGALCVSRKERVSYISLIQTECINRLTCLVIGAAKCYLFHDHIKNLMLDVQREKWLIHTHTRTNVFLAKKKCFSTKKKKKQSEH